MLSAVGLDDRKKEKRMFRVVLSTTAPSYLRVRTPTAGNYCVLRGRRPSTLDPVSGLTIP